MSGNKVVKASFWYISSSFLIKGIAFLTIPFFTRLMSKNEFGDYNNFISWVQIVMIIATLSLVASLTRARFDYQEELYDYTFSILILGTIFTSIIYLIVVLNMEFFENLLSIEGRYIHIMFIYLLVSPAVDIFQNIQRFKYKYKLSVFVSVTTSLSTVLLSVILVYCLNDKLYGRIIGNYIPLIVINIIIYAYYFYKCKHIKVEYFKYALKMCVPYVVHLLACTLLSAMDKTMITNMRDSEETALYSLAYSCSLVISILWTAMNTAYSPWLGEQLNANEHNSIKKFSVKYVLVFAVFVTGIMLIAPELLYVMGGKDYLSAKYVMPPVMLGLFFQFIYSMYVNIEQFEKRTIGMAIATIIAVIINGVLNYFLIPKFGYIAAAYTTLISYIALTFIHFLLVRRIKLDSVYDTKKIVLVIVIESSISVLCNILYLNIALRYLFVSMYIGTFLFCLYRYRKIVLPILKKYIKKK